MNKRLLKYCLVLPWFTASLFIWSGTAVWTARYDVRFNHLTLDDGLSQTSAYDLVQDRFGWMWLGTQDGLNRFDGHRITVFSSDEGALRLSEDWVRALYEQPGGDLWIGVLNGGLNRYDRIRERIVSYQHEPGNPNSLSGNDVRCIIGDNGDRDVLWVGVKDGGINRFHVPTAQVERFSEDQSRRLFNDVETIYEDRAGRLWVGSYGGLSLFDRATGQFQPTPFKGRVAAILELSNKPGVLWLGVGGEKSGLYQYHVETQEVVRYVDPNEHPIAVKCDEITSLFEDQFGLLWIGARYGLFRHDWQAQTFEGFFHDPTNPNSLTQDRITKIYEDSQGVLWVSTLTGGVNYCEPNAFQFRHHRHNPNNPHSLGSSTIRGFTRDRDNHLWVATLETGLDRFDDQQGTVTHYRHNPKDPSSLSSDLVHCVTRIGDDIWVGTSGMGLDRYNPQTNSFTHYKYGESGSDDLINTYFIHGDKTQKEIVWICTYSLGLIAFNTETGKSQSYRHTSDPNSISDDMVVYVLEESPELFWVCTMRGGLNLMDRSTGQFKRFKPDPDDPDSLSNPLVNSVLRDSNGYLWVSTANGLNRMKGESGLFQNYTVRDGLPNSYIYGCLEDQDGAIWISTNGGLSRLDPNNGTFHNYDVRDGLQSNEFNRGAFFKDAKGMMFFGGINGFNGFSPETIRFTSRPSPVLVTRFFIKNKEMSPQVDESPLDRAMAVTSSIILNHLQNDFAFEFAVMNITNADKNRYLYRLQPYNEQWVETDAYNRAAVYTNLDHGSYVFQVKGMDRYGVWSDAPPIKVRILPAPWLSPLAKAGYVLLFLALTYWVIYSQRKKLEQKNQVNLRLEQQVTERTQSLKMKNEELETLDRIVYAINRETDLEKLLETLLNQAIYLFPNAEKGGILLWDEAANSFRYAAAVGYDQGKFSGAHLTRDELRQIVKQNTMLNSEDLWLAETVDLDSYPENLQRLLGAKSILGMGLILEGQMQAVLFLACYSKTHAFDEADINTLERLREHTLSALAKTRLVRKLKEKTLAILHTQQQLLIQEKMASLGTLTAGIAHEINNPTNYAYGGAQNLERDLNIFKSFLFDLLENEKDEDFRKEFDARLSPLFQHANTIKEGALRIMNIVRDLHTFSHEDPVTRERINLNDHIGSAVNLVRGEFKERVQFETELSGALVVYCSPAEINQVVLNLLTNGCKAILKKQDEEQRRDPGLLKVVSYEEADMSVVVFQDNGCGMTESMRRKIFEPFFTTSRVGQGSGLGLASSYNIARKLGGTLEVVSQPGKGASITLKLPLSRS